MHETAPPDFLFSSRSKRVWNTHCQKPRFGQLCTCLPLSQRGQLIGTVYPTLDSGRAPLAKQITVGVRRGLACETLPSVLQLFSPKQFQIGTVCLSTQVCNPDLNSKCRAKHFFSFFQDRANGGNKLNAVLLQRATTSFRNHELSITMPSSLELPLFTCTKTN